MNANQQPTVPSQLSFVVQQQHHSQHNNAVTPETPAQQQQQHPHHDWQHMTRTIAHYKRLEQIGLGTYGQVYRAVCLDTGRTVALKKMRIMTGRGYWGMPLQLIREIKILKQLQHPNLLQMIEVVTSKGVEHLDPDDPITTEDPSKKKKEKDNYEEDQAALSREKYKGNLFLVLEYVTHDLTGLMDVAYQFTLVQIKCIFQQLLQALRFMHENKYVHRDIKSSNILLDSHYRLKLADFGLARSLEPPLLDQMEQNGSGGSMQDLTNKVITLWYRPPEILLGTVHYGCAVDVWSAGCILAELMTGKPLAAGKTELDQLTLLADLTGTPDADTWNYLMSLKKSRSLPDAIPATATEWREGERRPSKLRDKYGPNSISRNKQKRQIPDTALNLLEKLLEWDPRKRLSAANALQNRYFWTQPVAPENPAELGRIEVAADGHFHEFQTKIKRRQAKLQAEQARDQAILKGANEDEAGDVYDSTYIGIMKQVAQEGFAVRPAEPVNDRVSELGEKDVRKSREGDGDLGEEKKSRNRSSRSVDRERDRRKVSNSSRGDRERSRRRYDDEEDHSPEHKRMREEVDSDNEGDRRRGQRKRRDRPNEKDDVRSLSADRQERRNKETRRLSDEERKEKRVEKEKRIRKDSVVDDEVVAKEADRHNSPKDDHSVHTGSHKERRSKRSRHGGGSKNKKDNRSGKSGRSGSKSGDKERDRRHRDKRHGRNDRERNRDGEREDLERHMRPDGILGPGRDDGGRHDRGPPIRGDNPIVHYGPSGGRIEPRDGPWDRGPGHGEPWPDERSGFRDDRGRDRPPAGDHYGPPRRDRDRPPPFDQQGPSRRDRDGPPPRGDDFGPGPGRDRDGPPLRDDFAPGSRRDRDGPPPRNDVGPGPRRDRDGPPPGPSRRDRDGPPPRDDFGTGPRRDIAGPPPRDDFGPGPRRDRDGPPPRDDFGPGPRRDRDGMPSRDDFGPGPRRDRDGPPRGDFGPGGPRRDRDGAPLSGEHYGRRDGPPPVRGDFGGPGPFRDDGRDGPNRRPGFDSRRPRDRDRR